MSVVRICCHLAWLALAFACVHGVVVGPPFGESFARMLGDPWGLTVVVDLNACFVVFLAVVWLVEPRRGLALAMTLLTPLVGSFVPIAWFLLRGASLLRSRTSTG